MTGAQLSNKWLKWLNEGIIKNTFIHFILRHVIYSLTHHLMSDQGLCFLAKWLLLDILAFLAPGTPNASFVNSSFFNFFNIGSST